MTKIEDKSNQHRTDNPSDPSSQPSHSALLFPPLSPIPSTSAEAKSKSESMSSSASAAAVLALPRLTLSISSSSSSIHRNLRLPLLIPFLFPSSPSSSLLPPTLKSKKIPSPSLSLSPCPRLFFCSSSSSFPILTASSSSAAALLHDDQPNSNSVDGDEIKNQTEEHQEGEEDKEIDVSQQQKQQQLLLPRLPSPTLSVKEKKELASYAHSLGKNKKLKSQQVGKSGVTPSVATSFLETLEANELLKLKIHGSCPGELIDVIKQLEQATGSVAVDQIGRSVILYRPSPSKMKKREAASLRKPKEYPAFRVQKKAQAPGAYGEGRRQLRSS